MQKINNFDDFFAGSISLDKSLEDLKMLLDTISECREKELRDKLEDKYSIDPWVNVWEKE